MQSDQPAATPIATCWKSEEAKSGKNEERRSGVDQAEWSRRDERSSAIARVDERAGGLGKPRLGTARVGEREGRVMLVGEE